MRDTHRLKEKYELSLDSRQIVTLTVATVVVLGGVFVLGVAVGKKLATESSKLEQPTDILSAADQRTDVLAQVDKPAPLTFQEELTKKPEPAPELVKVAEAPKPAPAPVKPEPAAETVKAEPVKAEPAKVAATEASPEPTRLPEVPKAEPVPTRTNDAGALKEAFGRATQKQGEVPPEGSWTLQLSAYQDKAEAERFAAGLRDKGYAPYIVEANLAGKGLWYRVRMGTFGTKDAASTYLADFKRETSMAGIVTSN